MRILANLAIQLCVICLVLFLSRYRNIPDVLQSFFGDQTHKKKIAFDFTFNAIFISRSFCVPPEKIVNNVIKCSKRKLLQLSVLLFAVLF